MADSKDDAVSRIDIATHKVTPVHVGAHPPGFRGLAAGLEAIWVMDDGSVVRVDPATNKVIATIPVGPETHNVTIGAGAVWAPSFDEQTVYRIDPNA